MIVLHKYLQNPPAIPNLDVLQPWEITKNIIGLVQQMISLLDEREYTINNDVAVHQSASVESTAVINGPAIIGKDCFVSMNVFLRGGIILGEGVRIGPGCEVKSSIVCGHSTLAHFNFIGDSIIGSHVNFEAGSVIANHYNERTDKKIMIMIDSRLVDTGVVKFGALVGDDCKIGANAVLSPGTILLPGHIVNRLELIRQV